MKIDSKGNLIIGTTAILIVALLLICIFVISCINYIQNENIDSVQNDNFKYLIDDYTQNLEISQRDAIAKATQKIFNGLHNFNSENQIKKNSNKILDEKSVHVELNKTYRSSRQIVELYNKVGNKTNVNYVSRDGEPVEFVKTKKNATIEGLRDPLPLAKLTIASGILTYDDKIHYQEGLSAYMLLHQFDSPESYIEATAPLYIKKCPYDPYIHHGDPGVLDDCLKQGYFHESADGSCYLCRLEGKGKCPHYGFEVFIQTHTPLKNESLSCSDHVVFADHYNGQKIDPDDWNSLILDSSHPKKYGLDKNDR